MAWDVRRSPSRLPGAGAPAAQAVAVGNVVFVSGCTGAPAGGPAPPGVEHQVELALENAREALEALGSRMENVVKTFFLITSLDHYGSVRRTETEYYERLAPQLVTTPPAATLMVVPSLGRPELLVRYEVVAALDRDMPGWEVTYYPEFWGGKELAYPHVPKEHPKFARSQSIGNLLLVSGCQALDHESMRVETSDVAAQSRIVLEKVKAGVEDTGGSLANLLKTNVFIKDPAALATYREVERAFFDEHAAEPPASSVFVMSELPRPEFLIEVEAFAIADASVPGWTPRRRPGTAEAAESAAAGPLVFLSACDGLAASGSDRALGDEVLAALEAVRDALERAGSSLERLVKVTLLVRDGEDQDAIARALADAYRERAPELAEAPPATTFVHASSVVPSGARLQIDAVAVA